MIEPYDVRSLAFSPNGSFFVSASHHTVLTWSTITAEIQCVLEGHSRVVGCVAFFPCGNHVLSGSWGLWNVVTVARRNVS